MGNKSVHGHEVMQMMIDANTRFTSASLKKAIHEKFGAETCFHTCSAENMSADELIVFLAQRGKFVSDDDTQTFSTDPNKICDH